MGLSKAHLTVDLESESDSKNDKIRTCREFSYALQHNKLHRQNLVMCRQNCCLRRQSTNYTSRVINSSQNRTNARRHPLTMRRYRDLSKFLSLNPLCHNNSYGEISHKFAKSNEESYRRDLRNFAHCIEYPYHHRLDDTSLPRRRDETSLQTPLAAQLVDSTVSTYALMQTSPKNENPTTSSTSMTTTMRMKKPSSDSRTCLRFSSGRIARFLLAITFLATINGMCKLFSVIVLHHLMILSNVVFEFHFLWLVHLCLYEWV